MLYANLDYIIKTCLIWLPYDLWYAQYAQTPRITNLAMWQYTASGKVPGVSVDCDKNDSYMDYARTSTTQYYIIQAGDMLAKIAKKYQTTVSQLQTWNQISNPNKIYASAKICVK